ncbi:MAG: hypothetical protein ACKOWJ_06285 [Micrococcales bacterium]
MNWFKRWTHGLNPWLPYLLTTYEFQVIRGSRVDALIFGLACLLLFADWKGFIPWELPERPKFSKWALVVGLAASAGILFLSPRASLADIVLFIVMLPIALTLVYYRDHGPLPKSTPAIKLSMRLWVGIMVGMALCELFAFIWASVFRDDKNFPTVSVLMEPVLASPIGRTIFLVLWMLAGAYLLGVWRKRGSRVDSAA